MGQTLAKPDWTPQPHHQVVVEPASKPRNNGFGHFFDTSRNGRVGANKQLPLVPKEQRSHLFNRSPSAQKRPRTPIAQVIIHRPETTHRTRDYRADPSNLLTPPSTIPQSHPIIKHPPEVGGRFFHPPRTLALMDVGNRLAARGKEAKREWKDSLRAERARRFDDVCREYAALKVITEQDVVNRAKKEQKREAKRQREYTV